MNFPANFLQTFDLISLKTFSCELFPTQFGSNLKANGESAADQVLTRPVWVFMGKEIVL